MDVEEENSVGTALQGLPSLRQGNFSAEAMITKNRKLKPKRYIHTSADAAIEAPQLIKNESESILMRFFYQTITAKQPISAPTITTEHPISAPSSANVRISNCRTHEIEMLANNAQHLLSVLCVTV
eukprot:m.183417 g.183417  ORF g.183417 m.183417 type:complete len:126 (-) comp18478_c0_seq5:173-550(-)